MTTIIEMAREAGMELTINQHGNQQFRCFSRELERFAALVRADEREACAKVCEGQIKIFLSPQYKTGQPMSSLGERHAVASCAEAIRARGNT
jgi:hypothetical protein